MPGDISARIASLTAEKRALLERELGREVVRPAGIPRRARPSPCTMSFAQQRLWFLDQFEPGSPAYNLSTALRLPGFLDAAALERSLNEIVRRHEVLRTTFAVVDGQPVQIIAPSLSLKLDAADLTGLAPAARERETQRLASDESRRGFDLSTGPLFRAALLRLGEADHVLVLTMHHIISDGWSLGLLFAELTALYQAYSTGGQSPLAELPLQYADYSEWQRRRLQGDTAAALLDYWKRQLDGAPPVLELPTDRPRGAVFSSDGATQSFRLPAAVAEGLRELARREGATLFMVLLAAFKTLLHRYTGRTDLVVGAPIAGRNRDEIEGLIGFFVNTLVLRTDLSGGPTFRELLGRVREVTLGAYAHQDLPFEKLVEELRPERSLSHHPLFQAAFVFQNIPTLSNTTFGAPPNQPQITKGTAKFDLSLALVETGRELGGAFEYSTALFDSDTVGRMIGHFQTLLEKVAADPDARLHELPILTEGERRRLLVGWNDTGPYDIRGESINQLFEAQVEHTPEAVAVIYGDERITYRELNRRANGCAHLLRELSVGPEVKVALCAERSPEMVAGLLGILKAGGAFVPLDPAYPLERLRFMLRDSGVSVLATQSALADELRAHAEHVVCLDEVGAGGDENPRGGVAPDGLAYVIYTSGSTGTPKGVLITHRGLCNLSQAQVRMIGVRPDERVLQFASLSFDAAVFEIVMALTNGAALCLAPREALLPGPSLTGLLRELAITTVTLPPSALATMPAEELPALRKMIVAGEACPADLVGRWAKGRRFFNAYGPTEATIWATLFECKEAGAKPPIGRPVDNTKVHLLDASLQPVPVGGLGEIYIGGVGLARAYLNRPALTAERFVPDPFGEGPGARLYKTGDVGRYRRDGNIEFLGRTDQQVKLRGFRIELGEVEAALGRHPAVREAVVLAREDAPGDKRLVAYVVPRDGQRAAAGDLRAFLKAKLPEYMLPSAFVVLESLPQTPSGKVNRGALPVPGVASRETEEALEAPLDPVEEVLSGVWAEILGLERVGRRENFFELGGHSLLATQVVSRVRDLLSVELWVRQLFETPTVAELSAAVLADAAQAERVEKTAGLVLRLAQLTDDEAATLLGGRRVIGHDS